MAMLLVSEAGTTLSGLYEAFKNEDAHDQMVIILILSIGALFILAVTAYSSTHTTTTNRLG